jgi:hypothetical protein
LKLFLTNLYLTIEPSTTCGPALLAATYTNIATRLAAIQANARVEVHTQDAEFDLDDINELA